MAADILLLMWDAPTTTVLPKSWHLIILIVRYRAVKDLFFILQGDACDPSGCGNLARDGSAVAREHHLLGQYPQVHGAKV